MSRIIERPNNFKFWFRGKQSMQCAKRPLESGPAIINGGVTVCMEWMSCKKSTVSTIGRNSRALLNSTLSRFPSKTSVVQSQLKSSSTYRDAVGFSGSKLRNASKIIKAIVSFP